MARKVAYLGVFTALGLVLGWLESLLPVVPFAPGIKIGLANIVGLLILYRFGWKEAVCVNMLRIGLSSILFGNISIFLYSLAGMGLSLLGMILLKKTDEFSVVGVSVAGGVLHNIGQLVAAAVLMNNGVILYYLPILVIAGVIAGVLTGVAGAFLHKHLPMEIG